MSSIDSLIANNRQWAARKTADDPRFFSRLTSIQAPKYLWIGCADSRVPANEIVGLDPGELFVHRNVANVVVHTDLNCLSVLQFAVDVLRVEHVIVTGHYGCGGVRAALDGARLGLIDNWLRHVEDVARQNTKELELVPVEARWDRLCELNVRAQAMNVASTTIVQDAWARGQRLAIHSWIYALRDGLVRDLELTIEGADQLEAARRHLTSGGQARP